MNGNNSQSDEDLINELNESEEQKNVPIVDKIVQNNPFIKMGTSTYQNIQTQSLVKSSREEAGEQLAAINARNAEILRQQQIAEGVTKAKKTGVYVILFAIIAAILVAAVWLVIAAINASRQAIAPAEESEEESEVVYDIIDGYKCTSKSCAKITNIDSTRFIIHDGKQFNIYDTAAQKKTNTAIPEREYHAITPFKWGDKLYAILDPESEKSALYSISSNLVLTEFSYDDFIKDINDASYKDMKWVDGRYIIAKAGSGVRLLDISNGKEIARGGKKVFIRENFTFGYETDGTIRAYSLDGKNIALIKKVDVAFVRDNTLVVIDSEYNGYQLYNADGESVISGTVYTDLTTRNTDNYTNMLKKDSRYFQIPANN